MYNNDFFPSACKSLLSKVAYCALCAAFIMATTFVLVWFLGMG